MERRAYMGRAQDVGSCLPLLVDCIHIESKGGAWPIGDAPPFPIEGESR